MSNVYRIPVGYFRGRGAVTNTVSTTPYRSAGRPEAIFVIERLIDLAADQLGLDPVALRRRNMIPPASSHPPSPRASLGCQEHVLADCRRLAEDVLHQTNIWAVVLAASPRVMGSSDTMEEALRLVARIGPIPPGWPNSSLR